MNTTPPQKPQSEANTGRPRDQAGYAGADRDHSLDRAHEHLADICARLDGLRQRLGATLGNDDMTLLNAVVTELQSLAGLPNAAVDPDMPSGTAPPPNPQAQDPNRPHPQDHPDKRK